MGTKPLHTPETFLAWSNSLRNAGPMSSKLVVQIGGTRHSTSWVAGVLLNCHGKYLDKGSEIAIINGYRLSACQVGQPRGTVSIKSVFFPNCFLHKAVSKRGITIGRLCTNSPSHSSAAGAAAGGGDHTYVL